MYLVIYSHSVDNASESRVIVTDPQGNSTTTNITHYGQDLELHYGELNAIFNNVISQGYELFGPLEVGYVDNFPSFSRRQAQVFKALEMYPV